MGLVWNEAGGVVVGGVAVGSFVSLLPQSKGARGMRIESALFYPSLILLSTSLSAALLRRHLMVWKVFAPRWIMGVLVWGVWVVGVLISGLKIKIL